MSQIDIRFNLMRPRLVKLAGSEAMAPQRFTATFHPDDEGVGYELDVELDADGHSRCRKLVVTGEDRVPSIVKLPRLLQWATGSAAGIAVYEGPIEGGGFRAGAATEDEADAAFAEQASRAPTRRRDSRALRLEEAARAYNESGGSVVAIQEACQVEKTTAYRLKDDAVAAGLIP